MSVTPAPTEPPGVAEPSESVESPAGWFTTATLAGHLGKSPRTVALWRRTHAGPPFTWVGGRARYRPADVAAWLAANRSEVAPGSWAAS